MRRFAALIASFDETTRVNERIDAMVAYFRATDPADAAWAVHFLSGNRPKRLIPVRKLALWAMEQSGIPDWLFEECYRAAGDLAETIACSCRLEQRITIDLCTSGSRSACCRCRVYRRRSSGQQSSAPGVDSLLRSDSFGTSSSPVDFASMSRGSWWFARSPS